MSIWQQLGAYVAAGKNLSTHHLDQFAKVGGKWIVPVLYGDDADGPWNRDNIERMKADAGARGIKVGGWFNCWGGGAETDATNIAAIVNAHNLDPVILDLEASYQYPHGNFAVLPYLMKAVRNHLPTKNLCISTNGLNDSMIWNGRPLKESARRLGYRVSPQWYNSPNYSGCWTDPVCNMKWLKEEGYKDNLYDPYYANKRAVALSYVHPVLEPTGVEGSTLWAELNRLAMAKTYGFTTGFQLYLLERVPDEDWPIVAARRGTLYLT